MVLLLLMVENCTWCGVGVPRRSFSSSVGCIVSCGGLVWSFVVVMVQGVGDHCGTGVVLQWNTGCVPCLNLFTNLGDNLAETFINA